LPEYFYTLGNEPGDMSWDCTENLGQKDADLMKQVTFLFSCFL